MFLCLQETQLCATKRIQRNQQNKTKKKKKKKKTGRGRGDGQQILKTGASYFTFSNH